MYKIKLNVEKMLTKQKNYSGDSFQVLSNNRLEKDVQKIVYSLNYALCVYLNSKYSVRNGFIYSSGKMSHLLSFCSMLVANMACIYRLVLVDVRKVNKSMSNTEKDFFSLFFSTYYIMFMVGYTIVFILDTVHKKRNVVLMLKIQALNKSIDFSTNITSIIVWNWVSILTIIFMNHFILIVYFTTCHYDNIIDLILDNIIIIVFISLEINFVISIRIIILLRKYLYEWIKAVVIMNHDLENKEQCQNLLNIYHNIMGTYNLYKRIFQVLVSSRIFHKHKYGYESYLVH